MHRLVRFKLLLPHNVYRVETLVSLVLAVVFLGGQALAVTRFYNRSLYINNAIPGATSSYTISFGFHTLTTVGSIDLLFCFDPIPDHPCDAPTGLDVSQAVLSDQTGETGFTISSATTNEIVLSRTPTAVGSDQSSYTFTGIKNPTDNTQSFSARLSDYASTDASGALIDLGSVLSEVTNPIILETQVPPLLDFCLAQQVSADCVFGNGGYYSDMGDLDPTQTLTATSQMGAGTNASSGYIITVNGPTMSAGLHTIPGLTKPTPNAPGTNQFGINLVQNTNPAIGSNPDGASLNGEVMPNYDTPNEYMFVNGDEVAEAPNVALVRRYTISYIVNSAPTLAAGVYTTTLTFICSGQF
jgi:hypothetical protein